MINRTIFFLCTLPLMTFGQFVSSGSNTIEDLHLFAKEAASNQRILFVMLAPSDTDAELIARARISNRASVHLAYLTNGDGISDGAGLPYPHRTAARWRKRAYDISTASGSEHSYLNLPYIDAASSEERVRADWPSDTVRLKWRRMMREEKPDAVIITGFEHLPEDHPILKLLLSDIASATRRALRSRAWVPLQIAVARGFRNVDRAAGSAASRRLLSAERDLREAFDGPLSPESVRRTYRQFVWRKDSLGGAVPMSRVFSRRRVPDVLSAVDSSIQSLSKRMLRLRSVPSGKDRENYLIPLVDAMQDVDIGIAQTMRNADEARRFLLDWKISLERIRGVLLGVRVWWKLSEHILTERQITQLVIDSISGLDPKGRTEIFFPEVRNGWVVNEQQTNHLPYVAGQDFRLFASGTIPYDLPRSLIGLTRPVYRTPWYIFVVHQASTAEYTFSYRIDLGITGAPRFSPEVLTPIVRAVDGEEVIIRLTNYSRDGVYDSVYASGTVVRSTKAGFQLLDKDASETDTVRLDWTDAPVGPYLVNVMVSGEPVANFLARRFPVEVTEKKQVTLVADPASSALLPALKRLGYVVDLVRPGEVREGMSSPILVDEQIHFMEGVSSDFWNGLKRAADAGSHVMIFSQQAEVLAGSGLFPETEFTPTFDADTSYSIALTGSSDLLREPNDLTQGTWDGWIYRIATNSITLQEQDVVEHARIEATEDPVIFTVRQGQGAMTYIDLNLSPQWVNVLPASYTLLANLVEDEDLMGELE